MKIEDLHETLRTESVEEPVTHKELIQHLIGLPDEDARIAAIAEFEDRNSVTLPQELTSKILDTADKAAKQKQGVVPSKFDKRPTDMELAEMIVAGDLGYDNKEILDNLNKYGIHTHEEVVQIVELVHQLVGSDDQDEL